MAEFEVTARSAATLLQTLHDRALATGATTNKSDILERLAAAAGPVFESLSDDQRARLTNLAVARFPDAVEILGEIQEDPRGAEVDLAYEGIAGRARDVLDEKFASPAGGIEAVPILAGAAGLLVVCASIALVARIPDLTHLKLNLAKLIEFEASFEKIAPDAHAQLAVAADKEVPQLTPPSAEQKKN